MSDKEKAGAAESGGPSDNPMNLHGKAAEENEQPEDDEENK